MQIFKNKGVIAAIAVVLLLLIAGGVYAFVAKKKVAPEPQSTQENTIKTLQPEEIGLGLELTADKKNVIMTVSKLDKIKSIEYVASYEVEEVDKESGQNMTIPQGVTSGEPLMADGKTEISKSITLGTCSTGVCRYPKITSNIKFVIKVNLKDGSVAQVEDILKYPGAKGDPQE